VSRTAPIEVAGSIGATRGFVVSVALNGFTYSTEQLPS
jgi:hypothetical protein